MAIPPEPIDRVLPGASAAVVARVTRIVKQDPQKRQAPAEPGAADVPGEAARQIVELRVDSVLFGTLARPNQTIEVEKPAGDYALREGNKGPFLLQAAKPGEKPKILGRYGPDTYPLDLIRTAMKRHDKK